jgi:hypothetical protein
MIAYASTTTLVLFGPQRERKQQRDTRTTTILLRFRGGGVRRGERRVNYNTTRRTRIGMRLDRARERKCQRIERLRSNNPLSARVPLMVKRRALLHRHRHARPSLRHVRRVDVTVVVVVSGPFVSEGAVGAVLEGFASGDGDEDEGDGGRDESDPSDNLRSGKASTWQGEEAGGTRRTNEVRNDRLLSRVGEVLAAGFDESGDDSRVDAGSANHARLGSRVVLLERCKNGERKRRGRGKGEVSFGSSVPAGVIGAARKETYTSGNEGGEEEDEDEDEDALLDSD